MTSDAANFDKSLLEEDVVDLYENAPCGYISTLPDGTIVKVNATFLEWTGYTRNELLGKRRFQSLLPVAGRIYYDTHYGPLMLMQGYAKELSFEIMCAGGERLSVLLNSTMKKDQTGAPAIVRTMLIDARNRRAYEQELLAAKRRAEDAEASLRQLNDTLEEQVEVRTAERDRLWRTAQDILAIGTKSDRFLRCNPAFTAVLGWSEAEVKAMPYSELVGPGDRPEFAQYMAHLKQGKPLSNALICCRHKNGDHRWISWNIVPEGALLYFAGRDVTEEKRQADALRAAEEALRQAQKMEAVGQLTGGLAHDFNNLLAGIVGNLQMMRVRFEQGQIDELARYINAAESIADRAAALTHRMLTFARRQTLTPQVINVNELIGSMKDLIYQTAGPDIDINIEFMLADDVWATHTDRNQLESALLNLVINARDAMAEGGHLTIKTENSDFTIPAETKEDDVSPGKYVTISVADSGAGMSPDVLSRVFDPFFTTKPIGQGTGLGLSMIFGFVRQSGGHVKIHSSPGSGTTVKLHLPMYSGDAEAIDTKESPVPAWQSDTGATILLVDDEVPLRALLAEALTDVGYSVVQATDAAQALDALQTKGPIDMLITDVGLPGGMNGRQLADAARARNPALKVILITGYVHDPEVRNSFSKANLDVLNKPFSLDMLKRTVSTLMRKADTDM